MSKVYSNEGVEDLVWDCIKDSKCSKDFLDYVNQFQVANSERWLLALDRAVATFSPSDPFGEKQPQLYVNAFRTLKAHASGAEDSKKRAAALFHLGKMCQQGYGSEKDRNQSINYYKQAIALGEIRAFVNCGGHYDGPDATEEDLAYADTLFEKALAHGEAMGIVRKADRSEDWDDPERYTLYMRAAELGLPYAIYRIGTAHFVGHFGQQEDVGLGLSWLQRAARAGSAEASKLLGWHYEQKASDDAALSLEWQLLGAQQGNPACMRAVGLKHHTGIVSEPDQQLADLWIKRAAVLGDSHAQYWIAQRFMRSEERRHHPRGLSWMVLAADNSHEYAAWRAAVAFRDGVGCKPNSQRSTHFCKIAANAGQAEAQGQLGLNYLYGAGVEKDYDQAFRWINLCALQGEAFGMFLLGLLFDQGLGCEKNEQEAFRLFKTAADKGDLDAMHKLGDCYLCGHPAVTKDPGTAAIWYRKAAAKGHAKSMTDLGYILTQGEGVRTNYQEAYNWFCKAADLNERGAMYQLAFLYGNGDGVDQDEEVSRRWMARSAALGYQPAIKWIDENLPKAPQWLEQLKEDSLKPKSTAQNQSLAQQPSNEDNT